MQIRTYLGILLAIAAIVVVSSLALQNEQLLKQPFQLGAERSLPVYAAFIVALLLGALPGMTMMLVRRLRRELEERRERRRNREVQSIDKSLRRAFDHRADEVWSKAATELETVLTERPEDFVVLLVHGEALRNQGRFQEALDVHRRASVLYPRSVAVLYQMVEDYEALGEEQVAREIRNRILRDFAGQGLRVVRRRRDSCLVERDWEEALRWHERVESLRETGAADAQESEIRRGLTYQKAVTQMEKDRPGEAAQILRKLLDDEPRFIPAGIMLGEAELLQEHPEAALDEWKRGFSSTGSPVFLQRIEDHFIENAEPARAIETLRGLIAKTDNDLFLRFFLGRLYYRLEMHDDALGVLQAIRDRMDASPTFHYLLARIQQRQGNVDGAVKAYVTCLQRLGVPQTSYVCRSCSAQHDEWQDRCEICGSWNSVDFDIQEEQLSEDEMGVLERPFWGGYSGSYTRF